MKTEKMSFKNIKDVLSRDEMKEIMAGSEGGGSCGLCVIEGVNIWFYCSMSRFGCYCGVNPCTG